LPFHTLVYLFTLYPAYSDDSFKSKKLGSSFSQIIVDEDDGKFGRISSGVV
jgi:hypothetical protein